MIIMVIAVKGWIKWQVKSEGSPGKVGRYPRGCKRPPWKFVNMARVIDPGIGH